MENMSTANAPIIDAAPLWLLREAEAGDVGYIMSTWIADTRHYGTPKDKRPKAEPRVPADVHAEEHAKYAGRVIRSGVGVIACAYDDPGVIFGFALGEMDVKRKNGRCIIHYVYVRDKMRRIGIGRDLFRRLLSEMRWGGEHIHVSYAMPAMGTAARHGYPIRYNPYNRHG